MVNRIAKISEVKRGTNIKQYLFALLGSRARNGF